MIGDWQTFLTIYRHGTDNTLQKKVKKLVKIGNQLQIEVMLPLSLQKVLSTVTKNACFAQKMDTYESMNMAYVLVRH